MGDDNEMVERLNAWAHRLGWLRVHRYLHRVPDGLHADAITPGTVITWYESGTHDSVLLQINELPSWCACVYAIRYRICSGWYKFYPYKDERRLAKEAARLMDRLAYHWFATAARRRAFRLRHPECAGYSWRRIRQDGTPY